MDRIARRASRIGCWGIYFLTWLMATGADVCADRIVLRGGGQLRGKVLADPVHKDRVIVMTERGKTPLTFAKAQIQEVTAEPSVLDGYLAKREVAPDTAEGQYELGLWCEEQKLRDLAELHYEAAIRQDKGFEPAHLKLGHVKQGVRWLVGDEIREAQGLVRLKGKWVTQEEKDLREKEGVKATEQGAWMRKIRVLREALLYGQEDRRREAETQLMEIKDPLAVGPLMRTLGEDIDTMRSTLAHVLAMIPGPEAEAALVERLLMEVEPGVRHTTMDEIRRRRSAESIKHLKRGLRSKTPEVVNRAAWGIAMLDDKTAVPSLVNALVMTRRETVMAPSAGGFGEAASINATFGAVPPTSGMAATPIAFNGYSVGYLTPPAVGPGVVAYGAFSAPYYPVPNPMADVPGGAYGSSLANTPIAAGGGINGSRGPMPQLVYVSIQNAEVLSALIKLTGQDFGYNVDAWRRWVRTAFQAEKAPARRVPQP